MIELSAASSRSGGKREFRSCGHSNHIIYMTITRHLALSMSAALIGLSNASADTPPSKTDDGILLVAFGTSYGKARVSYDKTDETFRPSFSPDHIHWSYTSSIIRRKLAKQGNPVPSITESLDNLSRQGVRKIRVQSLHMAAGEEFSEMERTVQRYIDTNPKAFDRVLLGRPLLESHADLDEVVKTLAEELPKERRADEAVLYMAHGQQHDRADLDLSAVRDELHRRDPLTFMATVEGTYSLDHALQELKQKDVKTVWLAPFMIVAGDHANNDLVGSEDDSWASILKKEGFTVKSHLKGLGEMEGIRRIFLRHALETTDDMVPPAASPAGGKS